MGSSSHFFLSRLQPSPFLKQCARVYYVFAPLIKNYNYVFAPYFWISNFIFPPKEFLNC